MSEDTSNPVYKLITDNLQQALINVLIALFFKTKVLQGSVAMHLSCDGIFNDMSLHYHCWVRGWRILKLCQHLPKLWAIKYWFIFMKHGV